MLQRKILFATDFTAADRGAFRHSCNFARAWKAKLLIVHVNTSTASEASEETEASEPASIVSSKGIQIHPIDADINHEHITRSGDPVDIILEIGKEHDVDLIVLGTHGRKGVKRMFQGSVAESVIRSANCPVLTLRQSDSDEATPPSKNKPKILVPIDFSVYSYAALDFASSIALALDAAITILHVDDSDDSSPTSSSDETKPMSEQRKTLWEQLKQFKPRESEIRFGHKILGSPATKQIAQYARDNQYDYIVLGTHGRSGIGRALMGSVTEQVVRNADCPVVTVKPSNKRSPTYHP